MRAAVWSANQAGIPCLAADQFGDVDLLEICPNWYPLSQDYHELPDYLSQLEVAGWCYTGGLENHPRLVGAAAREVPLLGVGENTLKELRNPYLFVDGVSAAGWKSPETLSVVKGLPEGDWLLKPFRSGGGLRISKADYAHLDGDQFYLQRNIEGLPYSISFVAVAGKAILLGGALQFTSRTAEIYVPPVMRHESPYLFQGGITCCLQEIAPLEALQQLVDLLTAHFGLVGLCGLDLIKTESGEIFLLELNPRYTATMELLERQLQTSFLSLHLDACCGESLAYLKRIKGERSEQDYFVAKQIVYTTGSFTVPEKGMQVALGGRFLGKEQAEVLLVDLPQPGSQLPAGSPVCTVIAFGATREECLGSLRYHAGRLAIVLDQRKWSGYYRS
ncbi:MAG: ATP-grasp domain-containing protein [Planctomycetaceae bacterium]